MKERRIRREREEKIVRDLVLILVSGTGCTYVLLCEGKDEYY